MSFLPMQNLIDDDGVIYVYNSAGRIVGEISGGSLWKHARSSMHMLKEPEGWAWDLCIIEQAERLHVMRTKIIDDETGKTYIASITDFRRYGVRVERGYGPQLCLPIRHWRRY